MTTTKRSAARTTGLRLAAKVATVSGLAVAALGLVEARAASASAPPAIGSESSASSASSASSVLGAASDDANPLPEEGWLKAAKGGCGCAPCWGPPAPPPARSARRAAKRATKSARRAPRTARRLPGGAR